MKRHMIGKFEKDEMVPVGTIIVNDDNSYSIETEDPVLKERFIELEGEDIFIAEGIEGVNDKGNPVFAEVDKVVKPMDSEFVSAIEKYLPQDYGMFEIYYPAEEIQHRKTA